MSREHVADLAGVSVGRTRPVAIMGVINVSPESFHAGSVRRPADVLATALTMVEAGAALIDIGARSTAPYLETEITEGEEAARLGRAIERLAAKLPVPISADTCRPEPARVALEAGARVINDVSTLRDPAVARLVAQHAASLVLMAAGTLRRPSSTPVVAIRKILAAGLRRVAGSVYPGAQSWLKSAWWVFPAAAFAAAICPWIVSAVCALPAMLQAIVRISATAHALPLMTIPLRSRTARRISGNALEAPRLAVATPRS